MYNRPIYMREGGYASSFGSSINPSFSNNGVLENIQEQVSNNGDVLKSMQNRNQGTNTALSTQNPSTPDFNNNSDGSSAIDNLINNDPRFPKPRPAELTAFNPGEPNPFMRPENIMGSPINPVKEAEMMKAQADAITNDFANPSPPQQTPQPSINDVMGSGFRQEGDMARYVAFNEYNDANPNRPYQQSKPTNIFETYATSPLQSASSSINNPAVLQPTNSGTDSFPSGMLQNEMFGNMGRLQNIQQFANGGLADMGRFGDNQMVHAQTGEMVVPQSILQENPQIGMGLNQALVNQGLDPQRQVVGSNAGSINPMTGQQEFFDLGKIIKTIAPIAISAYLGPAAGAGLGSMFGAGTAGASFMSNPFVSRAITGALTSKLTGGSNKDALKNALLSGVSGAAFDGFS